MGGGEREKKKGVGYPLKDLFNVTKIQDEPRIHIFFCFCFNALVASYSYKALHISFIAFTVPVDVRLISP